MPIRLQLPFLVKYDRQWMARKLTGRETCRWHPQSVLTHEAGLAVSRTAGEDTFWKFSDVLFEKQEVH